MQVSFQPSAQFEMNRNVARLSEMKSGLNANRDFEGMVGVYHDKSQLLNYIVNCDQDIIIVENGLLKQGGTSFVDFWNETRSQYTDYIYDLFPENNHGLQTPSRELCLELCWTATIDIETINDYILQCGDQVDDFYELSKYQNAITRRVACHFKYLDIVEVCFLFCIPMYDYMLFC